MSCMAFDPSFTKYLPGDLVDENICAQAYGPEYTLINFYTLNRQRTWDPWFDVPNTNRKNVELMHYENPDGLDDDFDATPGDYAVYDLLPPTYCKYPSPGRHTYDKTTQSWELTPGYQAVGRMDNIVANERCADPPAAHGVVAKRETQAAGAGGNQTRAHPRDLTSREGPSGGFPRPECLRVVRVHPRHRSRRHHGSVRR